MIERKCWLQDVMEGIEKILKGFGKDDKDRLMKRGMAGR